MTWKSLLRGRLPSSFISLVVVVFGVFFLARLGGSDPTNLYVAENASAAQRAAFSRAHGFNDPVLVQFGRYLDDLVHLRLGTSLATGESAASMIGQAIPATLELIFAVLVISIAIAVVLGTLAAWYPNSWIDRCTSMITMLALSVPDFWIAIMFVLLFAIKLHWLPTSGMDGISTWVLPVATLMLHPIAKLVQIIRSAMIEVLHAQFVVTARSKGAPEVRVLMIHGLRNAALPAVTVCGDIFIGLINGAVVVEVIFGWPGLGNTMVTAIQSKDYAVLQAGVLCIAVLVFALNFVIDILYWAIDPRVRKEA